MTWPRIPTLDAPPLVRYGLPQYVIGANPAAGASFTRTTDGNFMERYVSISVRLVTDGNAANREVVVQYRDTDGNVYAQNGINATVAASLTADYFFSAFTPEVVATVNSSSLIPLQAQLLLPTHSMRIFIVNAQVGDQLSRIKMGIEAFYTSGMPEEIYPSPGPLYE